MNDKLNYYLTRFFFLIFSSGILFIFTRGQFLKSHDDPKKLILYLGLFLFISFSIILNIIRKKKKDDRYLIKVNKIYFWAIGFLIFYISNIIFNRSPYEGWVQLSEFLLLGFGCYYISKLDQNLLIQIIKDILFLSLFVFLVSLYYSYPTKVLIKPIGHVSYFSDFLLFLIPWAIYFFIQSNSKTKKTIYFFLIILVSLALFMATRRAPIIGLIMMLIFISIFLFRKISLKNYFIYSILLFFIFAGCFGGISYTGVRYLQGKQDLSDRLSDITKKYDKSWEHKILVRKFKRGEIDKVPQRTFWEKFFKSNKSRLTMFYVSSTSFSGVSEWMSGHGYGSFKYLYPALYENSDLNDRQLSLFGKKPSWLMHPHNIFIFYLFEGGLIGLSFILFFIILIIQKSLKHFKESYQKNKRDKYLILVPLISILGLLGAFNFDTGSTNGVTRYILLLNFSLIFCLFRKENFFKPMISFSNKYFVFISYLIIFSLMVISGYSAVGNYAKSHLIAKGFSEMRFSGKIKQDYLIEKLGPYSFDDYYFLGYAKYMKRDYISARKYLEEAYVKYPFVPQIHTQLAKTYLRQRKVGLFKSMVNRSLSIYPKNQSMIKLKQRYKKFFSSDDK